MSDLSCPRWRDDENSLSYRVVGFAANGWPAVKLLPNSQRSEIVNPAWFAVWRCTRAAA